MSLEHASKWRFNSKLDYLIQLREKKSCAFKTGENSNIKLRCILAQLNYQVDRDKTYLPFVNKNIAPTISKPIQKWVTDNHRQKQNNSYGHF